MLNNLNETGRQAWLKRTLSQLPEGLRILDAGAGELKNRQWCSHLDYVSQDFCGYHGGEKAEGLNPKAWDTSRIDIMSDITDIPAPDSSFDAILCSEVLEHLPEPTRAIDEFHRLLKTGGVLILTAPFASLVHMAPYYYCTGFSRHWYEYNLTRRGFRINTLTPNGDYYALLRQEITRLGGLERQRRNWAWPLAYAYGTLGLIYFKLRRKIHAQDLACFGFFCMARKIK